MTHSSITPAEVAAAYVGGETVMEIARRLGVGHATIWRRLQAAGIQTRRQGPKLSPQSIAVPTDPGTLGYVAGMFDGEGNLYWRRRTGRANSVRITIYSTCAEVINWLATTFSGGAVRWDHLRAERRGWKPIGRWELHRANDAAAFLVAVQPYLIIKRDLARGALDDLLRNQPAA